MSIKRLDDLTNCNFYFRFFGNMNTGVVHLFVSQVYQCLYILFDFIKNPFASPMMHTQCTFSFFSEMNFIISLCGYCIDTKSDLVRIKQCFHQSLAPIKQLSISI